MRRLLLGATALTAMSAAAFAADLPRRAPAVAPGPVYVAPIFTWSGFYIGLNAGVGFNGDSSDRLRAVALTTDPGVNTQVEYWNTRIAGVDRDNGNNAGFTGGVQIGYNWQFGAMVVGLEGDINYLDRSNGRRNYTIIGDGNFANYELDVTHGRGSSNWFGTIRPRIGVALDRTLIYATGGLAYGGSRGRGATVTLWDVSTNPDTEVGTWADRRSGSNWGWTLGAGVEHAFTNTISLKLEYLYVDLDRGGNRDLVAISGDAIRRDQVAFRGGGSDGNFHVVRAGLNWRFGGPAASAAGPVVAAY